MLNYASHFCSRKEALLIFRGLKERLCSDLVLASPEFSSYFHVYWKLNVGIGNWLHFAKIRKYDYALPNTVKKMQPWRREDRFNVRKSTGYTVTYRHLSELTFIWVRTKGSWFWYQKQAGNPVKDDHREGVLLEIVAHSPQNQIYWFSSS